MYRDIDVDHKMSDAGEGTCVQLSCMLPEGESAYVSSFTRLMLMDRIIMYFNG